VAKQRLTRKEIRQPDRLISLGVQMAGWVKSHVKPVLCGCAGGILAIGLMIGWSAWRSHRYQQAEDLLYTAIKLIKTAGNTVDPSTSSKATILLQDLTRNYARTPAAALAYWHLGHLYFAQKDYLSALNAYKQARDLSYRGSKSVFPALITMNIALAQEATQACAEAISSFETVLQSSARWLREGAYLGMGRCYESQGAMDKALATYDRALTEEISEPFRRTLEERVQLLGSSKKG
jgi:predicted negative regulator of RcsB-dependent stress response